MDIMRNVKKMDAEMIVLQDQNSNWKVSVDLLIENKLEEGIRAIIDNQNKKIHYLCNVILELNSEVADLKKEVTSLNNGMQMLYAFYEKNPNPTTSKKDAEPSQAPSAKTFQTVREQTSYNKTASAAWSAEAAATALWQDGAPLAQTFQTVPEQTSCNKTASADWPAEEAAAQLWNDGMSRMRVDGKLNSYQLENYVLTNHNAYKGLLNTKEQKENFKVAFTKTFEELKKPKKEIRNQLKFFIK